MSGFFGVFCSHGEEVSADLLRRAEARLQFRKPDEIFTKTDRGLGTCFARMDVATGRQAEMQPVWLGDRYALLGDVRLDAREELSEALQRREKFTARQTTDEELLLRAWATWGEAALEKLLGDFSFALWDRAEQVLWCARDFVGARPFFYAAFPGGVAFSNTLQCVREVREIGDDVDEIFIADMLLRGTSSVGARTVWRDIRRLKPGYRLRVTERGVDTKRFLTLPIEKPLELRDPGEYLEAHCELLQRAVADRLPDGKTSFYLSGGLDSAAVCAMAAKIVGPQETARRFRAFTFSLSAVVGDEEAKYARETAEFLRLPQEILDETKLVPFEGSALQHAPEPTSAFFLDRDIRNLAGIAVHSRVVMAGEGGDEVVTGQAWPYLRSLGSRGALGTLVRSFGGYFGTHGKLPPLGAGIRSRAGRWWRGMKAASEFPEWLNPQFLARVRVERSSDEDETEVLDSHPFHPVSFKSLYSGYWGMTLETEDPGNSGVPLQIRTPFLDLRIIKFLLRLPPLPWCMEKEITRRSMKGLLPDAVLKRPKSPLPTDPLEVCQSKFGWKPHAPKFPAKSIETYVQWDDWLATLQNTKGSLSWENLYPLALCVWLKGIETERGDSVK
jgi:asparagine synthase (glutamine-hydrolysing)